MSSVISTGITMDGQTCDAATSQKGRGVRRTLPAGVFDAAFSSLATFTVGFFAARFLEPVTLGGYALVFSAFLLLTKIPAQFLFKPAEIAVVSFPDHVRLNFLRHTLSLGALPALLPALALSL